MAKEEKEIKNHPSADTQDDAKASEEPKEPENPEAEKPEKKDIEDILAEPEKSDEDLDLEEAVAEPEEEKPAEEKSEEPDDSLEPDEEPKPEQKEEKPASSEAEKDELEKAEEEKVEETEKPKEKVKEKKKRKIWATVAIIFVTVLVTAAAVLGAVWWFYRGSTPKPAETSTETKAEEPVKNETTPSNSVYVNATDGLNLRKEPSATSEKLATIPYGTKLDVLETQGTWYKTTYNGLTGWVDSTYTQKENPLVYKNTKYGFQLTLMPGWGAYKVKGQAESEVESYYFELPSTDSSYKIASTTSDAGYASLFVVTVYSKTQYDTAKAGEGGDLIGSPAATIGNYVLIASPAQARPTDLTDRYNEAKDILKTIKAL